MSTCFFCETKLENIPDRVLRWCKCGRLGIDCSKEYTRYLGSKPKEEMNQEELENINKLKLKLSQPDYFKII